MASSNIYEKVLMTKSKKNFNEIIFSRSAKNILFLASQLISITICNTN